MIQDGLYDVVRSVPWHRPQSLHRSTMADTSVGYFFLSYNLQATLRHV